MLPGEGETPGIVKVEAPGCYTDENLERCLYPGTEVLVINATNGHVLWVRAGNEGQIDTNNEIVASIDDILIITVTDPFGNSTTFHRSQFQDPVTGETAVGPGGGTVTGPDGVELRIPEGALTKGVKFTLNSITEWDEDFFKEPPDLGSDDQGQPLVHFGSALQVKASGETALRPRGRPRLPGAAGGDRGRRRRWPARERRLLLRDAAPGGALRGGRPRLRRSDREVLYETVDVAQVEGSGEQARVVTASYPYHGYLDNWNSYVPGSATGPA